jgi:hypothetical protein
MQMKMETVEMTMKKREMKSLKTIRKIWKQNKRKGGLRSYRMRGWKRLLC